MLLLCNNDNATMYQGFCDKQQCSKFLTLGSATTRLLLSTVLLHHPLFLLLLLYNVILYPYVSTLQTRPLFLMFLQPHPLFPMFVQPRR